MSKNYCSGADSTTLNYTIAFYLSGTKGTSALPIQGFPPLRPFASSPSSKFPSLSLSLSLSLSRSISIDGDGSEGGTKSERSDSFIGREPFRRRCPSSCALWIDFSGAKQDVCMLQMNLGVRERRRNQTTHFRMSSCTQCLERDGFSFQDRVYETVGADSKYEA